MSFNFLAHVYINDISFLMIDPRPKFRLSLLRFFLKPYQQETILQALTNLLYLSCISQAYLHRF